MLLRNDIKSADAARIDKTLGELDAGVHESLGDVRELLVHFRTRTNTGDIEAALQETLQKFQHQTGLPAKLHVEGHGLPLPADVQVQVLHVLQESLSNVRKHAGAHHVQLDVIKGARWRFRVRDDGAGFDVLDSRDDSHVGLNIMRERAALIGATVDVGSEPGHGTTVTLTLPPHPVAAGPTTAPIHMPGMP